MGGAGLKQHQPGRVKQFQPFLSFQHAGAGHPSPVGAGRSHLPVPPSKTFHSAAAVQLFFFLRDVALKGIFTMPVGAGWNFSDNNRQKAEQPHPLLGKPWDTAYMDTCGGPSKQGVG